MTNISKNQYVQIFLILFFAFILRLYLSQNNGYTLDINWFESWSKDVYTNGFASFYANTNSDYPPLYVYILWIIGAVSSIFNIDFLILNKIPSFCADIITGYVIFLIAIKYTDFKTALISMSFYVFNPAIIYDSAIWGQVDSIYTLFLLLAVKEFISGKSIISSAFFTLSILMKPQSIVLVPLFIILGFKKYSLGTMIKSGLISIYLFMIVSFPFCINTSILEILKLYSSSYIQYPFTTMNAFNFWAFGGMFQSDGATILNLSYKIWGYILFGLFFILVTYFVLKKNDDKSIYISSAVLFFGFFMLVTRVHERYMFPVFAFLAIAIIFDKRFYYVYIISSITFMMNLYFVFEGVKTGALIPSNIFVIIYTTLINVILFLYLSHHLYSAIFDKET